MSVSIKRQSFESFCLKRVFFENAFKKFSSISVIYDIAIRGFRKTHKVRPKVLPRNMYLYIYVLMFLIFGPFIYYNPLEENILFFSLIKILPIRAPNTNRTHTMTKASIAVSPSAFGILVVMVLKMLTSTRNTVISRVIL